MMKFLSKWTKLRKGTIPVCSIQWWITLVMSIWITRLSQNLMGSTSWSKHLQKRSMRISKLSLWRARLVLTLNKSWKFCQGRRKENTLDVSLKRPAQHKKQNKNSRRERRSTIKSRWQELLKISEKVLLMYLASNEIGKMSFLLQNPS